MAVGGDRDQWGWERKDWTLFTRSGGTFPVFRDYSGAWVGTLGPSLLEEGREEAAGAGNWGRSKLTHWKKLRQKIGLKVTGRSLARKGERSLGESRVRKQEGKKTLKKGKSTSKT